NACPWSMFHALGGYNLPRSSTFSRCIFYLLAKYLPRGHSERLVRFFRSQWQKVYPLIWISTPRISRGIDPPISRYLPCLLHACVYLSPPVRTIFCRSPLLSKKGKLSTMHLSHLLLCRQIWHEAIFLPG